jgi:transcriptional regulator with XRE-family HTH domain
VAKLAQDSDESSRKILKRGRNGLPNGQPAGRVEVAFELPVRDVAGTGLETQRKQIEANLSADLVKYLQAQGMTLRQIADTMGLSESFISRVARKKRGLTIEHLLRLQEAIDKPLPLLLLEATSQDSVLAPLAPLYEKAREVLAAGMALEQSAKRRRRKTG